MVPLTLPSCDMERRSVSMATWLGRPSRDSPFTATSWSLTCRRPSCKTQSGLLNICVRFLQFALQICLCMNSVYMHGHTCLWVNDSYMLHIISLLCGLTFSLFSSGRKSLSSDGELTQTLAHAHLWPSLSASVRLNQPKWLKPCTHTFSRLSDLTQSPPHRLRPPSAQSAWLHRQDIYNSSAAGPFHLFLSVCAQTLTAAPSVRVCVHAPVTQRVRGQRWVEQDLVCKDVHVWWG